LIPKLIVLLASTALAVASVFFMLLALYYDSKSTCFDVNERKSFIFFICSFWMIFLSIIVLRVGW